MKEYSYEEMEKMYSSRREKIYKYLVEKELGSAVFIDNEDHRDPAIRYFTGHPSDAVLIFFQNGKSVLIPWDEILAKKNAFADKIIPFTRYKNSSIKAVQANLNAAKKIRNMKVEIPPTTTYPEFLKFIDALPGWDVLCKERGIHEEVQKMRMIKDNYEIECIKEACRVGDLIIDRIEEGIKNSLIKTEMDVALLIERLLRENGCEKTGFDTLAAGPMRSFAIHAFPGYTDGLWPSEGLSILDFGVVYKGYTSDTTLTVAKGKLTPLQEKMLNLVKEAFNSCLECYKPGKKINAAALLADQIFQTGKMKMPHGLGHAIGLEIHEGPRVSAKTTDEFLFKPGMVLTLEPGLYDEQAGGVRLEDDVLITEQGNEVLSCSRIIYLD